MAYTAIPENEYGPYYANYMKLANVSDLICDLRSNRDEFLQLFKDIDAEKMLFRYRERAWNLKQMIQHITDSERVFAYRAMSIARGDKGPFPGYNENEYADAARVDHLSKELLIYDFIMGRNAHISLFESFLEDDMMRIGVASESPVSVRALGHLIIGHAKHHMQVIQERYLSV